MKAHRTKIYPASLYLKRKPFQQQLAVENIAEVASANFAKMVWKSTKENEQAGEVLNHQEES